MVLWAAGVTGFDEAVTEFSALLLGTVLTGVATYGTGLNLDERRPPRARPPAYLISGSRGRPRMRSPIWLRLISDVPPAIDSARCTSDM